MTRSEATDKIARTTSSISPSESGCLLWPKFNQKNYPFVWIDGRHEKISRVLLAKKLGRPIKEGYLALHICDHPSCVNEDHIYEGTDRDNMLDMVARHWRYKK